MKLIPAALIAATLATPAAALEPLSQEKYINDRLIAARIADRIRRTCPSIDGRILYAYGEARKLKRYAESKGYSRAEIDAFLDSRPDKQRIYAVAEDYLTRQAPSRGTRELLPHRPAGDRAEHRNRQPVGGEMKTWMNRIGIA